MIQILKKEKVMTISLFLAAVSMCFVFPDRTYLTYIDFRVLSLLFCLMVVVKGFQNTGLFELITQHLFGAIFYVRPLVQCLILLCFISSMLVTNDVALITFVPFSIQALILSKQQKHMILVIILETLAANLGSMLTPIGNPQNLYLYSVSGMSFGSFLRITAPITVISLILLMIASFLIANEPIVFEVSKNRISASKAYLMTYSILFLVNLLVVFHLLPWYAALFITIIGIFVIRQSTLIFKVDYALLLTFVGFFIFVGNIGRIPFLKQIIQQLLTKQELLLSVGLSQVMSNVPTAILLSGFTHNYKSLLIGTNIGGLGTLIASMASLISYKQYAALPGSKKGIYMIQFTVWNLMFLLVLLLFVFGTYR